VTCSNSPSPLPKVSIVLPYKDEEKTLHEAVISLVKQDYSGPIEILAVNDGSKDDSTEILKHLASEYSALRLIEHTVSGVAAARNAALSEASGQVIVNFSAHAFACDYFLRVLVEKLTSVSSCVAGVGCKHVPAPNDSSISRAFGTAMRSTLGGLGTTYRQADVERFVESVAFTAYRAELFRIIGEFDSSVVGNEDGEFNLRVRKAGYRLLYSPEAIVYHHEVSSPLAFLRKMIRYGEGRARTIRKHPWSFRFVHACPCVALLALVFLSIGGLFDVRLLQILIGLITTYIICVLVSALAHVRSICLPALIIAFPIIHLGYGVGFIGGFFRSKRSESSERRPQAQT